MTSIEMKSCRKKIKKPMIYGKILLNTREKTFFFFAVKGKR